MFTGIVQGRATISKIENKGDLKTFCVQFPAGALSNIQRGASIALNGVCLTVTAFNQEENEINFDVMSQTLKLTNLDELTENDEVNFERAAKIGDEIGGHMMSGHVLQTLTVLETQSEGNKFSIRFEKPESISKYIFDKGFIGINGCSLTIGETLDDSFSVYLIPETLDVTTFSKIAPGNKINLELDPQTQTVVETVERYLERKVPK